MHLDRDSFDKDCERLRETLSGSTSTKEAMSILFRWSGVIPGGSEKIVSMRSYLKSKRHDERDDHYFRMDVGGLSRLGHRFFDVNDRDLV